MRGRAAFLFGVQEQLFSSAGQVTGLCRVQ